MQRRKYEYDTIRDHWRGFRCDRVCNSHIRNNHRDAHCVLGDLHCLHWLVKRFIGENEDGFLHSIAICWIWSRNCRSVIRDRFCHLGLVGLGIGYFRRRFLVFHIEGNEYAFDHSDRNL